MRRSPAVGARVGHGVPLVRGRLPPPRAAAACRRRVPPPRAAE